MRVFSRTLGGEARYHHRCGSVLLQLLEVGSPTAIMAYICRQRGCVMLAQEALHRFTAYQGDGPYTERDRNARDKAPEFTGRQFPNLDFDGAS